MTMTLDFDVFSHKTFEGNLTTKPVSYTLLYKFHTAELIFS